MLWNSRNLISNLSEFKIMLYKDAPHIAGICETWLKPGITPKFHNYSLLRKDRDINRGGGLAMLIRNDIKSSQISLQMYQDGYLEVLAIKLACDFGWGNILLCYNPCKNISVDEFNFYFQQIPYPQFIFGDFNAKHKFWSPSLVDSKCFEEIII